VTKPHSPGSPDAIEPSPALLTEALYWMRLTRAFDERADAVFKQGKIVGGRFSQLGHEAISVGAALALGEDDVIAPLHRDLGAFFVRGLTPRRMMAQLLGRVDGPSRGRDANMHGVGDLSLGIVGYVSMLPASMPVAAGVAMAFQYKNEPRVAMTFFGDGSSSEGLCHETLNWASVFKSPIVFILENNHYAYSTPLDKQFAISDLADRAQGYGFPGVVVDGNDLAAVYAAARAAVERARQGLGPTLIECKTFRMRGHAIHDNQAYVPQELIAEWAARDPIARLEATLREHGLLDDAGLAAIEAKVQAIVDDALEFAERSPTPDPATLADDLYAPARF
jgi:TPP-dependent pyruvate/acetoin dehydrogenase alpha subunit